MIYLGLSLIIIVGLLLWLICGNMVNTYFHTVNKPIYFNKTLDLLNLPVVTFYQNKKKLNFLIDTGSTNSVIDSNQLLKLTYYKTNKEQSIFGMEGKVVTNPIVTMSIKCAGLHFTEEFASVDMSKAFEQIRSESGVTLHGILGSDFLNRYNYVLDFSKMALYIK